MTDHQNVEGSGTGGPDPSEEDLLGPELRALLSSLPRELSPERDLTQDVAARTWDSLPTPVEGEQRRPSGWWSVPKLQLAAAAAALVVITSLTTTFLVREKAARTIDDATTTIADATINPASRASNVSFASYDLVEAQYTSAISELAEALESQRDRLPAETVRLIEENLRIIDEAIQHSLAALRATPESLPLQQAVMTSYERKLDFLRQAAALTAEG
jgi:hypothetical protein